MTADRERQNDRTIEQQSYRTSELERWIIASVGWYLEIPESDRTSEDEWEKSFFLASLNCTQAFKRVFFSFYFDTPLCIFS
jgi:hypothetical protein